MKKSFRARLIQFHQYFNTINIYSHMFQKTLLIINYGCANHLSHSIDSNWICESIWGEITSAPNCQTDSRYHFNQIFIFPPTINFSLIESKDYLPEADSGLFPRTERFTLTLCSLSIQDCWAGVTTIRTINSEYVDSLIIK